MNQVSGDPLPTGAWDGKMLQPSPTGKQGRDARSPAAANLQQPHQTMHTAKIAITLSIMVQMVSDFLQSAQNRVRNPKKRQRQILKPLGARLDPQKRTPTLGCDAPCMLSPRGHDPPQPCAECIHTITQCHTATQMGVLHLKSVQLNVTLRIA